jgi:hypothetical protein
MKAYIYESEFYPCYSVSNLDKGYGEEVDVSEEKIEEWKEICRKFYQAQTEMDQATFQFQFNKKEIDHLNRCFDKVNPSRTDKAYLLNHFGWKQVDTSVWEKDGRQVRLHQAYAEIKQIFQESH